MARGGACRFNFSDHAKQCENCVNFGKIFVDRQAPGAGVRPRGSPRISSDAQSRLPRFARRTRMDSNAPLPFVLSLSKGDLRCGCDTLGPCFDRLSTNGVGCDLCEL